MSLKLHFCILLLFFFSLSLSLWGGCSPSYDFHWWPARGVKHDELAWMCPSVCYLVLLIPSGGGCAHHVRWWNRPGTTGDAATCVTVGVSLFTIERILCVSPDLSVVMPVSSERVKTALLVFVCFLSCLWRAGEQLWSHQACQQGHFFIRL